MKKGENCHLWRNVRVIKADGVIDDALLYLLEPAYLGTWDYREMVHRLSAAYELDSGHVYGGKNQISNLAFIDTCAKILLFFY